jgi:hypothetical protein
MEMWMDVDTALSEVPVNLMPLLDDTDFKTRETAVAYNAAGMDIVWNFVTTGGQYTQTPVTPTTGGAYDWTHQGDGMYSIEIPASGGASINNDTEGYGWFTGVATGVLPWRGPVIGFRHANINNVLVNGSTAPSTYAGGAVASVTGAVGSIGAGGITAASFAAGAIDAAAIAADAIGSSELAASAITEIQSGLSTLTAAQVAAAVWDEPTSGNTTSGTFGAAVVAAGSAGDPWATSLPGAYGAGTAGKIIGDNLNATVSSRASQASVDTIDDFLDTEIADIRNRLPAALVSGRMDVSVGEYQTGLTPLQPIIAGRQLSVTGVGGIDSVVTTANVTNGVIVGSHNTAGATSLRSALGMASANLDTQLSGIPAAVWAALTSALTTVGSIGKLLVDRIDAAISSRLASASYTAAPSASAVADAVWDEARTDHTTTGTFGYYLDAAVSSVGGGGGGGATAAEVWDYLTADADTVGSVGKLLVDKLSLITTGEVQVTSPVNSAGELEDLYQNTEYSSTTGQPITFSSGGAWVDMTGGSAYLILDSVAESVERLQKAGTINNAGTLATQSVTFSLTASDLDLPTGEYSWQLVLITSGGKIFVPATGRTTIKPLIYVAP